ncbi:MAG: response regulator [Xanthomonadales bacterium]|nr:response regulator [Xanthomonadales bacterium]MBP6078899.1 response regulator [Xanthomonadales bacterium]
MIRVIFVDDHAMVRTGYRASLASVADIQVVGEAGTGEDGVKLARELKPHVVLMDLHLPGISGLEAASRIHQHDPDCKVIALTGHNESPFPRKFIEAGAAGYVTKDCPVEELVQAIRTVASGRRFISQHIAQAMALDAMNGAKSSPFEQLTKREIEIVVALAQGEDMPTIGKRLHVTAKTIASHKYNVFKKLDVDSDVALAHMAIQHGLVDAGKKKPR